MVSTSKEIALRTKHRRFKRLIAICFLLLPLAVHAAGVAAEKTVWLIELEGSLGPAKADFITRRMSQAESADVAAIILRINTPGGLDASMRQIVQKILGSRVPVVSYVAPSGARAASAGTYIVLASHVAAMAPATNIGSSTPVQIGGTPALPRPAPGSTDDEWAESDESLPDKPKPDSSKPDAMTQKIVNDASAYIESIAEMRGRNVDWASRTVRESLNIRASEAVRVNLVDLIANDLSDLLAKVDGMEISVANKTAILQIAGASIEYQETDWRHELLEIITDPSIAYGLLMIGIWGLILEFYSPGMILPSVLGAVCILLGAYGLQMLPINMAGIALILLGLGLMVAEVVSPTVGVFGITGIVSFVIGSLILVDSEVPEYQLPVALVAGFAGAAMVVMLAIIGFALRASRQVPVSGLDSLIGQSASVVEGFCTKRSRQVGRVEVGGELWDAMMPGDESISSLQKGDVVRIAGHDGLTLIVGDESHDGL